MIKDAICLDPRRLVPIGTRTDDRVRAFARQRVKDRVVDRADRALEIRLSGPVPARANKPARLRDQVRRVQACFASFGRFADGGYFMIVCRSWK